uniref:BTB domain-containing protein n=1 Tax=Clytia hemisphaerica TaxID=252671 RepID=A0A7M5X451_9CNID
MLVHLLVESVYQSNVIKMVYEQVQNFHQEKNDRITRWLNENTVDKEDLCLPYFYIENVERTLPILSMQKMTSSRTSRSTVSDFSSSDEESLYDEYEDNDSVFGSIINEDQFNLNISDTNKRGKLTSDVVISKTIQGFEVLKVKWNTLNNDLLLKVENKLFPVHKNLLTAQSSFLNDRLKNNDDLILEIPGTIAEVTVVLEIIYECEWSLNENNVNGVLKICKYLKLKSIVGDCEQYKKFLQRSSSQNGSFGSLKKWKKKTIFKELFNL